MKIAVISGKGGSGKSSVSAAFIALSQQVVAVDCDVDASNLPLLFKHEIKADEKFVSGSQLIVYPDLCRNCGHCVSLCAFGALKMVDGKLQTNDLLCEGCNVCVRHCPHGALYLHEIAASDIYVSQFGKGTLVHGNLHPGDDNSGKMIARLRQLADAEMEQKGIALQILDGPPGIGCPVLSTVTGMDRVVIVCEPTLSGISDLQRACEVTTSFCNDIKIVINKADINAENCQAIHRFCRERNLPVVAELPFDRKLVEAQLNCESIVTYAPDCTCSRELRRAYEQIFTIE